MPNKSPRQASSDEFAGVTFPESYEQLLKMTKNCMGINRRLTVMVGNMHFTIEEILMAYQGEDAQELHAVLDRLIASKVVAQAMTKAATSAGVNAAFPTIQ